ncbi:MAG: TraR/DksA family transcriptional regulator [Gemmatimonadota bacterium]|nr:TraR/DksA family transcriptional regulator [Gemmatimonadota bacterium]
MLSKEERDQIEKLLLRERELALDAIEQFQENEQDMRDRAGELSLYRMHMADLGTESQEKEKEFLLASQEGRRLYQVDEALRRLYKDPETFGTCERCGREIGFQRLEVIPYARYDVECQSLVEQT